jgi:microcystin-dependent protein
VSVSIGAGYAALDNRQPAIHTDAQQPAITVANAGGGAAHQNMPAYVAFNIVIRYL